MDEDQQQSDEFEPTQAPEAPFAPMADGPQDDLPPIDAPPADHLFAATVPVPLVAPSPDLLRELASIDESNAAGPMDAPVEEPPPREKHKRIPTSAKVVLVVALWLLLTLVLVGRYSAANNDSPEVARLDSVAGIQNPNEDVTDELTEEEVEVADANGDGVVTQAEAVSAGFADLVESAESSGTTVAGGTYTATPAAGGVGAGGVLPGAAPGGSTTTSAAGAGAGTTTTTSTTAKTTTTTGGSGPTSTTRPTTTTTSPSSLVVMLPGCDEFSPSSITVPRNGTITFRNDDTVDRWVKRSTENGNGIKVAKNGGTRERGPFETPGVIRYECDNKHGFVNVTVL